MKRVLYIGNKLSAHGYTPTSIETLGSFFADEGYSMVYASAQKNPLIRFLDMGWTVFKNRTEVDYVIIDTYSTFSFWYAFMVSQLCRLFAIKYIPILHGGNLPHRLDRNPVACKMLFHHSYKNVAPSGYLMDAFQKRNFPHLLFIPNTIHLGEYPYLAEREVSVPKLLWVRSFASLYHPKMAVDVLKGLQKHYPEAALCMVGPEKDGSLAETKVYANEQGVAVTFTGRLSRAAWVTLSKEYNVFINTTNFDNTPVSVLEAMCLGLPVVSTAVGGIPFLLKDKETALLTPAGDVDAMVAAVQTYIEDAKLRSEIITHSRHYVEGFDWERVKLKWHAILV